MLIKSHENLLWDEFQTLLDADKMDGMSANLCSRSRELHAQCESGRS